ncbi:hypothetical protein AHiyo4_30100 [Arthrobacter sp. Hiyo4]|nr:hypothetical protein AHiyo4_30100 [Arthrobacter sp. Hiyo4]
MRKLPASGLPGGRVSDRKQAHFRASAAARPTAGAFAVCLAVLLSGCTGTPAMPHGQHHRNRDQYRKRDRDRPG